MATGFSSKITFVGNPYRPRNVPLLFTGKSSHTVVSVEALTPTDLRWGKYVSIRDYAELHNGPLTGLRIKLTKELSRLPVPTFAVPEVLLICLKNGNRHFYKRDDPPYNDDMLYVYAETYEFESLLKHAGEILKL